MPLGVYMDADTAKRLAATLKISIDEYWNFVMEDLVTHNHNAIALSHVDQMSFDDPNVIAPGGLATGQVFPPDGIPIDPPTFTPSQ